MLWIGAHTALLHGDRRNWGRPGTCRTCPLGQYFVFGRPLGQYFIFYSSPVFFWEVPCWIRPMVKMSWTCCICRLGEKVSWTERFWRAWLWRLVVVASLPGWFPLSRFCHSINNNLFLIHLPPVTGSLQAHLEGYGFHLQNPDEVMRGEKPIVKEVRKNISCVRDFKCTISRLGRLSTKQWL